ncbi:MAG: hypothetical protein JW818_12235 [Pirellulales bacterium]|nr:hypothetical protein [Pirellulales bacterium]
MRRFLIIPCVTAVLMAGVLIVPGTTQTALVPDSPTGQGRSGQEFNEMPEKTLCVLLDVKSPAFRVDHDTINTLVHQVLTEKDTGHWDVMYMPLQGGHRGQTLGTLTVYSSLRNAKLQATAVTPEQVVQKVRDRLQETLTRAAESGAQLAKVESRMVQNQVEEMNVAIFETQRTLDDLRHKLADRGVIPGSYYDLLGKLQAQRFQLRIELAGLEARQEATVKQIAVIHEQQKKGKKQLLRDDPVFEKLRAILEAREREYNRMMLLNKEKAGGFTQADVEKAATAIVVAKAELRERQQLLEQQADAGILTELNHDLTRGKIKEAELERKYNLLEDNIKRLSSETVRFLLSEYEGGKIQLDQVLAARAHAVKALPPPGRETLAHMGPKVEIISTTPAKKKADLNGKKVESNGKKVESSGKKTEMSGKNAQAKK